jgi:hypothetical protein
MRKSGVQEDTGEEGHPNSLYEETLTGKDGSEIRFLVERRVQADSLQDSESLEATISATGGDPPQTGGRKFKGDNGPGRRIAGRPIRIIALNSGDGWLKARAALDNRSYLEKTLLSARNRLTELEKTLQSPESPEASSFIIFLVLVFSEYLYAALSRSDALKDMEISHVLEIMEDLIQITVKEVSFMKKMNELQVKVFQAFGVSDGEIWELETLLGDMP